MHEENDKLNKEKPKKNQIETLKLHTIIELKNERHSTTDLIT